MKKYILIIIIAFVLIPQVSLVHAEEKIPATDSYTLIEPLPCITGVTKDCNAGEVTRKMDIKDYIMYVYKFALAISVFLAIIMIIWGGFLYITSEIPFIKSDGKGKIEGAVTGLALILVSYLILVTIDPRLVEVYSEVPPINIKTEDAATLLTNYQAKLVDELKAISKEDRESVLEANAKIRELEIEKERIENQLDNGIIEEEERDELIKKADIELKKLKATESVLYAKNVGLTRYMDAISILDDPNNRDQYLANYTAPTLPNPTGTERRPTNSKNKIQNDYNIQINELLKTNANATDIQKLERQRDFITTQILNDVKIKDLIISHSPNTQGMGEGSMLIDNTKELSAELKVQQAILNDKNQIDSSGLPEDQYKKIIQARVDSINQALGITPPKPPVETPPKP